MNNFSKITILIFGLAAFLLPNLNADDMDDTPISLEIGYRHDSLIISSRGNRRQQNLSETQDWRNINSIQFGISAATYTEYNVFFKGKLDYSKIYHADFNLDTLVLEGLNRRDTGHSGGNTYSATIAVGFPIFFDCRLEWLHFIPLAGFDYDRLKVRSHEKIFTGGLCDECSSHSCDCSPHRPHKRPCFVKAHIHNHVVFESPWAGLDLVAFNCQWKFYGGYQYNFGRMRSRCEYNVKKNFSFALKDRTCGHANTGHLGVGYQLSTEWEIALQGHYKNWRSHHGKHRTTLKTPQFNTKTCGTIKNVNWVMWDIMLYLTCWY